MSRRRLCVLLSGGALLLALGGIMIPVVDMVVKDKIKEVVEKSFDYLPPPKVFL